MSLTPLDRDCVDLAGSAGQTLSKGTDKRCRLDVIRPDPADLLIIRTAPIILPIPRTGDSSRTPALPR